MELRDYLRLVRAHWVALIALTLLGALAGFGWSAIQPRVYTADASGYVQMVVATDSEPNAGSALVASQAAQGRVKSYLDMGTWRSVAEYAIDDLGLDISPETLVQKVSVSNPIDSVIIRVDANAATPEGARDLASAWIRGMARQINLVETGNANKGGVMQLIAGDSARLPDAPSSPNTRLNIAFGALAGLAIAVLYVTVRRVLDRRVRSPRDVEKETGVAVVGTLPLEKQLQEGRRLYSFDTHLGTQQSYAVTEAMRELRTNLQYMDVDNPPRVIVVTSPIPGDGKSTTAANLAVSLAATGERVVLVDADLRRPMLTKIFDMPEEVGLSDILAGRATVEDVAHRPTPDGTLTVIGAGRTPPNPSEVLGSQRMKSLISSLSEDAIVLIDSPPTIPVTDAAILTASADGALMVISAGRTTFEMLQKALGNIEKARGRALGVVMNKVPRRGAEASYYGYRYEGSYYSHGKDAAGDEESTTPSGEYERPSEGERKRTRRSAVGTK